jgi:hypothetical protein
MTNNYYLMMQEPWLGLGNGNQIIFRSKNPELFALHINQLRPEEFGRLPEIKEPDTDFCFEAYHRELDRLTLLVDNTAYELPPITEWWWPHAGTWEEGDRKHKKLVKHVRYCLDLQKALY